MIVLRRCWGADGFAELQLSTVSGLGGRDEFGYRPRPSLCHEFAVWSWCAGQAAERLVSGVVQARDATASGFDGPKVLAATDSLCSVEYLPPGRDTVAGATDVDGEAAETPASTVGAPQRTATPGGCALVRALLIIVGDGWYGGPDRGGRDHRSTRQPTRLEAGPD
ncbi:hypothetical protein AB0C34_06625 [Nocardia sp. NPDC049220]|uniref:hypothetical protein n=1 Tax=Nocardia sp. NPDC049220 TaxID=3155273 RepID=UPI003409532C